MKILLCNFLSVVRRFKLAMTLNVLGLSVAFAAFLVIWMQVDFDRTFNRADPSADRIFRVDVLSGERGQMAIVCRPLAEMFLQSSPHIVAGSLCDCFAGQVYLQVDGTDGERDSYKELLLQVNPSFTKVFDFQMLEGDRDALADPGKALIPESLARKFFGKASAVGRLLRSDKRDLTVGGVYRDFPENSSFGNPIYASMGDENLHSWSNWNYSFFVRLDKPESAAGLLDNFYRYATNNGKSANDYVFGKEGIELSILPLSELHFAGQVLYDMTPKVSRSTIYLLVTISFLILLIAAINFTNFSTALAPMRIRSINTQRVLGASLVGIRSTLVAEALFVSLLACLIALLWVYLLQYTPVAGLLSCEMQLAAHKGLVGLTLLVAVATGLFAGLYPSFYMTSFQPALVLKGSFGLSPAGRRLRSGLIGIQYVASFALIIGSLFMYLQNRYMQHTPLGYDKEALIVTDLSPELQKNYKAFASQMAGLAEVQGVTFAEQLLSSSDQYMNWGRMYHGEHIDFQCLPVDAGFLELLGIPVTEGRSFTEGDLLLDHGSFVFNEAARKKYNLKVEDKIDDDRIVGFMPDVKFASFRMEVTPMAFFVWGKKRWDEELETRFYSCAYIKVKRGSDLVQAIGDVRQTLRKFDPDYPFNVRFFDEVLNNLYEKEQHLGLLITLFSAIAVFISLVGVFGLVVFESEYKRKEIGIRKVLGSTTGQIVRMFNRAYLQIVGICFILAAPLAWLAVNRWLENFAYKAPLAWWVYGVAFLFVALLTVATVTLQVWRVANDNPVHSIKSE